MSFSEVGSLAVTGFGTQELVELRLYGVGERGFQFEASFGLV